MTKQEAIALCLDAFTAMGADFTELMRVAERLENDEAYLLEWTQFLSN